MARERIQLKDLSPIFKGMAKRTKTSTYRTVMAALLPVLRKRQRKIFATETSPTGERWEPNRPETIRRKKAAGQGVNVLVATKRLRDSLRTKGHSDNVASLRTLKGVTRLLWGTNVEYSIFHQRGTRQFVARPHIVSADDKLADILVKGVVKKLVKLLSKKGK